MQYWNTQAASNMLDAVATHDLGTGCTEEDFKGLVALGVVFPDLATHDINEAADEIKAYGDAYADVYKPHQPMDMSDVEFEEWLGI